MSRNDEDDRGNRLRSELSLSVSRELGVRIRAIAGVPIGSINVIRSPSGKGYVQFGTSTTVHGIHSPSTEAKLTQIFAEAGYILSSRERKELVEILKAYAAITTDVRPVWLRVAAIPGGFELYVGDADDTRIQVTPGNVKIVREESTTFFYRSAHMQPFALPAETGDLNRLDRYLNLSAPERLLYRAYVTFVLAHPKGQGFALPILVFVSGEGTGKTVLCRVTQRLIDPSAVGLQSFPKNERDLAIAAQQSHLLLFDNVREIKPAMADALCIASTGGALTTRALYTDDSMAIIFLHIAVVINGIHVSIDQPDLAQRCLPLTPLSLEEGRRISERALMESFEADLPVIFQGLLELIANVLKALPAVEPIDPERMVEFSHWLAAMERVDNVPAGVYQAAYTTAVNDSIRDSLMEHPVAAAVMTLVDGESCSEWVGTSTSLLRTLERTIGQKSGFSRQWPQNAIALSKQLLSIQAALKRQGIDVWRDRGHERRVTITRRGGTSHD